MAFPPKPAAATALYNAAVDTLHLIVNRPGNWEGQAVDRLRAAIAAAQMEVSLLHLPGVHRRLEITYETSLYDEDHLPKEARADGLQTIGWINGTVTARIDVGGGWLLSDKSIEPYARSEIGDLDELMGLCGLDRNDADQVDAVLEALAATLPETEKD